MPEDRRHERLQPRNPRTVITLDDGRQSVARLIDVSTSGAGVATDLEIPLGQRIVVGRLPAKVVRLFEGGIAVEFGRILTDRRSTATSPSHSDGRAPRPSPPIADTLDLQTAAGCSSRPRALWRNW